MKKVEEEYEEVEVGVEVGEEEYEEVEAGEEEAGEEEYEEVEVYVDSDGNEIMSGEDMSDILNASDFGAELESEEESD